MSDGQTPARCEKHDLYHSGACFYCNRDKEDVGTEVRYAFLQQSREILKLYLTNVVVPNEDWHGVMDAAADLREIDAEIRSLEQAHGKRTEQGDVDRQPRSAPGDARDSGRAGGDEPAPGGKRELQEP